jgi:hypothetical protein
MSLLLLGTAQALASGISIIQNLNSAQKARKEAAVYGQQLQDIKETNTLLGLKSPDISGLQAQQTAAQTAQATQAIQGMGPEGAAQVANIYQAGLQQNAENMQRQAEADFQTDLAKRQNEQQVQFRNISAERALVGSRLEGAQTAASEFKTRANENLTAGLTGLGKAIGTYATGAAFDYGAKAARIQALIDGGMKLEDAIKKEEENNQ